MLKGIGGIVDSPTILAIPVVLLCDILQLWTMALNHNCCKAYVTPRSTPTPRSVLTPKPFDS